MTIRSTLLILNAALAMTAGSTALAADGTAVGRGGEPAVSQPGAEQPIGRWWPKGSLQPQPRSWRPKGTVQPQPRGWRPKGSVQPQPRFWRPQPRQWRPATR